MEHYYSEEQKSHLNIKIIRQKIKNMDFDFYTASGVFSKEKVDKGTLLLAENMLITKNYSLINKTIIKYSLSLMFLSKVLSFVPVSPSFLFINHL